MVKSLLQDWLEDSYLKTKPETLQQTFHSAQPFPHLVLADFFKKEKIILVLKALAQEKFILKDADLFTFLQTDDLVSSQNKTLQEFRSFLASTDFTAWLSSITDIPLKSQSIDIAGTVYESTHYLLPHDDQLEGRKIAYFLYLSNLTEKEGGALTLYSSQDKQPTTITKKIIPQFNTFSFFQVSTISFHQVQEILSDTQRITVSGWFHGN